MLCGVRLLVGAFDQYPAVRAAHPGDASPLREFARLPGNRAAMVRGFAADLTDRYGTAVNAHYDDRRDQWELTWTLRSDGEPSERDVRAALSKDRDLAPHARHILLRP
jgi:hypothetical protein